MNTERASLSIERNGFSSAFIMALALGVIPVIGIFFPRVISILPGIAALGLFVVHRLVKKEWLRVDYRYLVICVGVVALSSLSSLWALDSDFALKRSGKIALVLLPSVLLFSWSTCVGGDVRAHFFRVFPVCALACAVVCVFDLYTNGLLYMVFHDMPEGMGRKNFNYSLLNRSINICAFTVLISLYCVFKSGYGAKVKKIFYAILSGLMVLILYRTDSQSAQVVVIMGLLVTFLFPVGRDKIWGAVMAFLALGVMVSPWLVQGMYSYIAESASAHSWLAQAYAADRMEIWDMVARKALESPFIGFGIEATRHIEHFDTPMRYTPMDHVLHPHNFMMQIWIEFGVLGAFLTAGLLIYLVRVISLFSVALDKRFVVGIFAALLFAAATTYGLWQGWWLGLICYIAALIALIVDRPKSIEGAQ